MSNAAAVCQFIDWADLNNVELNFKINEKTDVVNCVRLLEDIKTYEAQQSVALNNIGAADFVNYLNDHIGSVSKQMVYEATRHYKMFFKTNRVHSLDEASPNNAHKQPNYVMFVVPKLNLKMILGALGASLDQTKVPSASLLIFEVLKTTDGLFVEATYNDEALSFGKHCAKSTMCTVNEFRAFLTTIT
jgi:hypothetical protein